MYRKILPVWFATAFLLTLFTGVFYSDSLPKQANAADNCQTFAETGFSVCGRFLEYWKANGGLTQQGFPISDVFEEQNAAPPAGDGKIHKVQYFQRARFEEHLENQPPYDVLLGLLGAEQYKGQGGSATATQPVFLTVRGVTFSNKLGNFTPKANYRVAVADLLMVNTTKDAQFSHSGYFRMTTVEDYDYIASKPASDAVEKPMTPLGYLQPGERSTGQIAFEIPINETPKSIMYRYEGFEFVAPIQSGGCQTFSETGFTVCGKFLEYWKANGGLAQQGFPISPVFEEQNAAPPSGDGKIHKVQYFQRARFEEHTENAAPYDVLLGLLGAEQYQTKYANNPPSSVPPPSSTPTQSTPTPIATIAPPTPTTIPAKSIGNSVCLPAITTSASLVQACVSNSTPAAGANVTVYGRLIVNGQPAGGAQMNTSWHYKTTTSSCSSTAGSDGIASCTRDTGRPTKGYTVTISVYFTYNGQNYSGSTSFTPQ